MIADLHAVLSAAKSLGTSQPLKSLFACAYFDHDALLPYTRPISGN
jgi:hypothetical protein